MKTTVECHHTPIRIMEIPKRGMPSADQDVEQENLSPIAEELRTAQPLWKIVSGFL